MHIGYLCNEYPTLCATHGGLGTFVRTIGRALVERGHAVTVIGLSDRGGETDDRGIHTISIRTSGSKYAGHLVNGARLQRALGRLHRAVPVDILEAPELGLAAVPRRFPAVKVIRMHGGHRFFSTMLGRRPRRARSWLERRSFRHADAFCAVSTFVAETTRRLLKMDGTPITVLPNPVDTDVFRPRTDIRPVPGRIVFVGTLCEKKGIRQLVQAMPEIIERIPPAHLVVAGRDRVDPDTGESFRRRLVATIERPIAGRIEFIGPYPNHLLPELLATAEVLVYPSHMEAMPVAWLEGLAMGKPVVASRTGPGPELIEDGVSGLLCNPHDPASIAERVVSVLADRGLRARIGAAARARAVTRFSLDTLVKANESFYARCATHHARG